MVETIRNTSAQCQVVYFPWVNQNLTNTTSDLDIAKAGLEDISAHLLEVSFNKNLGDPEGTFEITLANSKDWTALILPRTWLLIYLSQEGGLFIPKFEYSAVTPKLLSNQRDKLRAIGYIERVSKSIRTLDKGEQEITYRLSGKDFGCIYGQTNIWHNTIFFEKNLLDAATNQLGVAKTRTVNSLIETLHKLIYSPADILNNPITKNNSLTTAALQWILPLPLIIALGLTYKRGVPFFGNINNILNFEPTACNYPIDNPISALDGRAWDTLKNFSIEFLHELYPELDDSGHPKLNFRPIPWRIKPSKKTDRLFTNESKALFKNIPRVYLDNLDIIASDLGTDTHSYYNVFYLVPNITKQTSESGAQAFVDLSPVTGFPRIQQSEIKRDGLRLFFREVNTLIQLGIEKVDRNLVQDYNELILEYWDEAQYFESGTMEIIGNNAIRVGKVLELSADSTGHGAKLFYIEGYQDTFKVLEDGKTEWTQNLMLTRGIEKKNIDAGILNQTTNTPNLIGEFTPHG